MEKRSFDLIAKILFTKTEEGLENVILLKFYLQMTIFVITI